MGTVSIDGGAPITIYGDLAGADAYISSSAHGHESWADLEDDDKGRALVTATRLLNRQRWQGVKTSSAQALAWPRTGVTDAYGDAVDDATIPEDIINAGYELAIMIVDDPEGTQSAANGGSNEKRLKAGSAEVEFFRPETGGRFPTIVEELIGQYLAGSSNATAGSESWGTDGCSAFDDDDSSGLAGAL